MEKKVLAAASFEKKKYYFAEEFSALPLEIQQEVQILCVTAANQLMCTFVLGFFPTGDLFIETVRGENAADFDDIGAELTVKKIRREKKELLKALKLWYLVFCTPEGEKLQAGLRKESPQQKEEGEGQ